MGFRTQLRTDGWNRQERPAASQSFEEVDLADQLNISALEAEGGCLSLLGAHCLADSELGQILLAHNKDVRVLRDAFFGTATAVEQALEGPPPRH